MHQLPPLAPLVLLLAAVLPAARCLHLPTPSFETSLEPHDHQHHWGYHTVASEPERDTDEREIDGRTLRHALQQLLDLNDGELQSLMAGMSPRKVAPSLEPSTAFLLASSRQYLERLNTILSTVDDASPAKKATWNPRIARRHKKRKTSHRNPSGDAEDVVDEDDPDSILGALTELSQYLSGGAPEGEKEEVVVEHDPQQDRKRRSHHQGGGHKHQSLEKQRATKYETHHYLYYLRTGECPLSGEGIPKMFCPSPYDSGDWECIADRDLCDGVAQCPNKEDEAPTHCLFYNAMRSHVDELREYLFRTRFS